MLTRHPLAPGPGPQCHINQVWLCTPAVASQEKQKSLQLKVRFKTGLCEILHQDKRGTVLGGETLIAADLQEALAVSGTRPINSVSASSLVFSQF